MNIGFEQTTYATEEGSSIEVCAAVLFGFLEREALVRLTSQNGTAGGEEEWALTGG